MIGRCEHSPIPVDWTRVGMVEVEVHYWCMECGNFTVIEADDRDIPLIPEVRRWENDGW